ncbi:MAG: hypothetical protein GX438_10250 [Treponema sp.]|nr:hypothetical protein [Treponema sp.]
MKKLSIKLILFVGISIIMVALSIGATASFFLYRLANTNAQHLETMLMGKYDEEIRWQTEQANTMLNAIGKLRDEGKIDKDMAFR